MIYKRTQLRQLLFLISVSVTFALISACSDSENPTQPQPVEMNDPPVLTPVGDHYASVNNVFQLLISATDSESTPALTVNSLPAGATFVDSGNGRGLFSWTPTLIHANSMSSITIIATDDSMSVDSEVVTLNVINYTFNNFVSQLVQGKCTNGVCHGGVDTTSALNIDSYISFIAGGFAGNGIVPRDTTASIVFQKLGATPPFGSRMPQDGPPYLAQSTLDSLAIWILAGAPES